MKKYIIFLFLLSNLNFYPLSDLNKSLVIYITSNYKPINYIHNQNYINSGFNFSFLSGFKINEFTLSLEIDNDYYSLNGINDNKNINGAFNTFRFAFSSFANVKNRVEFKLGAGGLWRQSPHQISANGDWKNPRSFGITTLFNIKFFMPVKFFNLLLINKYDMLFIINDDNSFDKLNHIYYGALRFIFNPYVNWFNFYIEFAGSYIFYENLFNNYNNAMFSWNIGFSLDLNIPLNKNFAYKKSEKKTVQKVKEKTHTEKIEIKIQEKTEEKSAEKEVDKSEEKDAKKKYTGVLKSLYNSKINDKIIFNNIIFEENKVMLTDDSYKVLDIIAEILIETKKKIYITAYSELQGNPLSEIELATNRGEFIRNYLIGKKVIPDQLKVKYVGTIYNKKIKNDMPKIIFDIIE